MKKQRIATVLSLVLLLSMSVTPAYAATDTTGHVLTDLFSTEAFSGSWEVFSKFNWLGWLMQFIISAFCLIGLVLVCYQRVITMLYLSAKNTFDRIDELKTSVGDRRFLGLGGMFKDNFFESKNGIGLDAFVNFLLTLMPNVKAYSDYAPDKHYQYNLNEDDTITTYMLKVAIPTIMVVFFFSIGFNGTLFKAYGNVVDALATVADDFVESDLSGQVQRWVNSGTGYQFAYENGTAFGEFKQNLAEDCYAKLLRKSASLTTTAKQDIGAKVAAYVDKVCGTTGDASTITAAGFKESYENLGDDAWKNLNYTIAINSTQKFSTAYGHTAGEGLEVTASNLGLSGGKTTGSGAKTMYLHVIIQKKANSNETDYFKVKDGNTGGGKTSGGKTGDKGSSR